MIDGNYNYSTALNFEGKIDFWSSSFRLGKIFDLQKSTLTVWWGGCYLIANSTLRYVRNIDRLGELIVEIEQQPVNPFTLDLGAMVRYKALECILEIGANTNGDVLVVSSFVYRF